MKQFVPLPASLAYLDRHRWHRASYHLLAFFAAELANPASTRATQLYDRHAE
jgi:hypothetical protein